MAYIIQKGDTLSKIAAANGTTVDVLAKSNNISNPDLIQAGASINIPGAVPPAPVAPTATPGEQTQAQREATFAAAGQRPVIAPTPSAAPISTSDLARGTQLPDASTYATANTKPPLSDAVGKVAATTLTSTGVAIDTLMAQREAQQKADADAAKAKVDGDAAKIEALGNKQSTANQDALAATRAKFDIDQKIADLTSIQTKIAAAQEALNMGLIYEADRPARQQLLLGRSASLQKQGLATIGMLQASAQIIQGNIDLAESYAKTTIDAINTDNKNAMDALGTLLALHNDGFVTLAADEKATLDARLKALQDQDKKLQQDSTDIFDLMSQYPSAALAGGVTLLDDRSTALTKMLPKMSAMEMQKFNAALAKGASTASDKDGPAEDKAQLLSLKANGMTYQEALNAFSDTLSVDWINAVYRQPNTPGGGSDAVLDNYYGQFLNEDGSMKPGYTVSIDPAHPSAPQVTKTGESGGASWWNPFSWF